MSAENKTEVTISLNDRGDIIGEVDETKTIKTREQENFGPPRVALDYIRSKRRSARWASAIGVVSGLGAGATGLALIHSTIHTSAETALQQLAKLPQPVDVSQITERADRITAQGEMGIIGGSLLGALGIMFICLGTTHYLRARRFINRIEQELLEKINTGLTNCLGKTPAEPDSAEVTAEAAGT